MMILVARYWILDSGCLKLILDAGFRGPKIKLPRPYGERVGVRGKILKDTRSWHILSSIQHQTSSILNKGADMLCVNNNWNCLPLILILLTAAFSLSCGQKDIYEGIYKAQQDETAKYSRNQLELMEKGQAVWRLSDAEVSFRWDIKDSEIWLSTKSGGIIIGKIHGDIIQITLPGANKMSFKKSKSGSSPD